MSDIETYLDAIVGNRNGHLCVGYGIEPYRNAKGRYEHQEWNQVSFHWPTQRDALIDELDATQTSGRAVDVYVCPAIRFTGRRTRGNALPPITLWADLDGEPADIDLYNDLAPMVVGSGSDGHQHIYVPLTRRVSIGEHRALNYALAQRLGADAKWSDEALLRMPGSRNYKPTVPVEGEPGQPTTVTLIATGGGPRDPAELAALLGVDLDASRVREADAPTPVVAQPAPDILPAKVQQALARLDDVDRSAACARVIGACRDAGLTEGQALTVLLAYPPAERYKGTQRAADDVARLYAKGRTIDDDRTTLEDLDSLIAPPQAAGGLDSAETPDDAVTRLLGEMLTSEQLDDLEPLRPVIDGLLYEDSVARIVGASGHGKSFVAIDMAASVATATEWHGRAVEAGPVVYLVAEGARGIRPRVRAWERHHGTKAVGVHFLPRPLQATGDEWAVLVEACRRLRPKLIILDTQARITVGVDENSNPAMGVVVDQVEKLRTATGACALLVHHRGLSGEHGRGASAVKAALQTELSVSKSRDVITLSTDKQKDSPELDPIELQMTPVRIGADELGFPITSIVPTLAGADAVAAAKAGPMRFDNEQTAVLAGVIREVFDVGTRTCSKAEVKSVVLSERGLMSKSSFYRGWSVLEHKKRLLPAGGGAFQWRDPDEFNDEAA